MFEILFICLISIYIFKISIYNHKKVAIFITLLFSTTMKVISTVLIIKDNNNNNININNINNNKGKLYTDYKWIIPIGIIMFILVLFIKDYSYCRLKWLFDLKYISEIKILIIHGFIGTVFCLIGCIISSNIKCIDKEIFNGITYICRVSNNTYYDHFLIYFQDIWKEKREIWINIIYVILILIKIILSFLNNLFLVLIIKYLSPEYKICSNNIYYFITEFIKFLIFERDISILFEFLAEVFSIIGAFIYLEFIELNFCKLNYYLKKNIINRSLLEEKLCTDFSTMNNDNDNDNNKDLD